MLRYMFENAIRWMISCIFLVLLSIATVVVVPLSMVTNRSFYKSLLRDSGVLDNLPEALIAQVGEENNIDTSALLQDKNSELYVVIKDVFNIEYTNQLMETIVDTTFDVLEGKTSLSSVRIPLLSSKAQIKKLATYLLQAKLSTLPICTPKELLQLKFDSSSLSSLPCSPPKLFMPNTDRLIDEYFESQEGRQLLSRLVLTPNELKINEESIKKYQSIYRILRFGYPFSIMVILFSSIGVFLVVRKKSKAISILFSHFLLSAIGFFFTGLVLTQNLDALNEKVASGLDIDSATVYLQFGAKLVEVFIRLFNSQLYLMAVVFGILASILLILRLFVFKSLKQDATENAPAFDKTI